MQGFSLLILYCDIDIKGLRVRGIEVVPALEFPWAALEGLKFCGTRFQCRDGDVLGTTDPNHAWLGRVTLVLVVQRKCVAADLIIHHPRVASRRVLRQKNRGRLASRKLEAVLFKLSQLFVVPQVVHIVID